jgi:ABC-type transport system involved in multi-copper enzyme maturation permease subunit
MTPGISQESTNAAPAATNDWFGHTWRLVAWNLKLARRRLMSKILLAILLVGFLLVMGVLFFSFAVLNSSTTAGLVTNCPTPVATATSDGTNPTPTGCDPATVQQETQALQDARTETLQTLTFPKILSPTEGYTSFIGIILLCILAGAVVGGEYSFGTQRLALSRGVSRAQVLIGQIGMLAALALGGSGGMLLLSALIGLSIGPALGGTIPAIAFDGVAQLLGFWLALALHLFAYALVALLLATLGRSTAAGIGGSLGYVLFEVIGLPIVTAIAYVVLAAGSNVGHVLEHIQDFFLSPNLAAIINGVNHSPLDLGGSSTSTSIPGPPDVYVIAPLQGLIVTLLYCTLLIGLSYWAVRKRDVTH